MPGVPLIINRDLPKSDGQSYQKVGNKLWMWSGLVFCLFLILVFLIQRSPLSIDLPHPLPEFVGRKEVLGQIKKAFSKNKKSLEIPIVTLWGEGGVGKTETALFFANSERKKYSFIAWINSGSEALFEESYRHLAEALKLPLSDRMSFENVRDLVHNYLENKRFFKSWLLIFDNGEASFPLPQRGKGKILITARSKLFEESGLSIEVPCFTQYECESLYKKILNKKPEAGWIDIVQKLDLFPLAVNQAAHYIKESPRIVLKEYPTSLSTNDEGIFELEGSLIRYPHTLKSVWEKSSQAILSLSSLAYEWLKICAYLHPDQIPMSWVEEWLRMGGGEKAKFEADNILKVLSGLGHIHLNYSSKTFAIHRMKQALIKSYSDEDHRGFQEAEKLLVVQAEPYQRSETLEQIEGEKDFLQKWAINADWWIQSPVHEKKNPFAEAKISNLIGNIKNCLNGDYKGGKKYYQAAIKLLPSIGKSENFEDTTITKAIVTYNLALNYRLLRKLKKSEETYKKVLEIVNPLPYEIATKEVIASYRGFGEVKNWEGEHSASKEWFQKALTLSEPFYKDQVNYQTIELLKWLGNAHEGLGELVQSIEYYIRSMEGYLKVYQGKETLQKRYIFYCMGDALGKIGEVDLGLKCYEKAIKIEKQIRPNNCEELAILIGCISDCYFKKKQYKTSYKYSKKIERLLAGGLATHSQNQFLYYILGQGAIGVGHHEEGESYLMTGLEIRRKNYLQKERDVKFFRVLGLREMRNREWKQAIDFFERALKSIEEFNGTVYWEFSSILENLGEAWSHLESQKAKAYLQWASDVNKHTLKLSEDQKGKITSFLND